jgi:hypothetical protein
MASLIGCPRKSKQTNKKVRFELKQTETQSVSVDFRFVSWNQKQFFSVCFGVSEPFRNNQNNQICLLTLFIFKGIVSRDLHICFLVLFDTALREHVLLRFIFRFRVEFFDFASRRSEHTLWFFRQNNICMSVVVGSLYGAITVATESLIAQLDSQGKLTKLCRDANIGKFDTKRNFKSKWIPFVYVGTLDLSIDTKKNCANLVRLSL